MADLAFLNSSDLDTFTKRIVDESLFADLAPAVAAAKFDSSTWSPETRGATSFLQAFLASALGEYARQDARAQTAKVTAALPALLADPSGTARPEGVSESAFEALRGATMLKTAQRDAQAKVEERNLNQELMKALLLERGKAEFGAIADNPKKAAAIRAAFAGTEAPQSSAPQSAIEAIEDLPAFAQGKALEELAGQAKTTRNNETVRALFEQARKLNSAASAISGTTDANALNGIRTGLETAFVMSAPREPNEGTRLALAKALPDWNDTVAQLDAKEILFNQIMSTVPNATPLLDSLAGPRAVPTPVAGPAPEASPAADLPSVGQPFAGGKVTSVKRIR